MEKYISINEAEEILKGYGMCVTILTNWKTSVMNRINRREMIFNNIGLEEQHEESLYCHLRRTGQIIGSRKTFKRDIDYLVESKRIEKRVVIGGKNGSRTFINRKV